MFICTELFAETGRPPGLICGLTWTNSSLGKNSPFDGVMS